MLPLLVQTSHMYSTGFVNLCTLQPLSSGEDKMNSFVLKKADVSMVMQSSTIATSTPRLHDSKELWQAAVQKPNIAHLLTL
ncbi:hypothetical protein LXL04_036487 [Taraxacum kok-saghyz]